jgi:hypothetical protein
MRRFTDSLAASRFSEVLADVPHEVDRRSTSSANQHCSPTAPPPPSTRNREETARAERECRRGFVSPARTVMSWRSADLPLGSPIRPVPPPMTATGECPWRCMCASAIMTSKLPTCRLAADGSKRCNRSLSHAPSTSRTPSSRHRRVRAIGSSLKRSIRPGTIVAINARLTRRAALKGVLGGAAAAIGGTAAYGVVYERHRLGPPRPRLPVAGLPAALNGLRIALLTDIHHSALVGAD